ncbi:hypothetical protein PRZ48_008644 [Zasmidium cellare]|uniref:Uncharacterized protein n=1 Tax=Zasmidium cellare TaxID=395010 RepID=A0ABR0EGP2_ZASCE|nr:hypothetical protein PRZ48_008644 [Zasmidium cellare]
MAASDRPKKGVAQTLGGKGRMSNSRRAADAFMDLSGMDGGDGGGYSDKENEEPPPVSKPRLPTKRKAPSPLKETVAKKMKPMPMSPVKKQQPPKTGSLLPSAKPEPVKKDLITGKELPNLKPAKQTAVATASETEATTKKITTDRPSPSKDELHIDKELANQSNPLILKRILNNSFERCDEIKARLALLREKKAAVGPGAEATDLLHEINAMNMEGRLMACLSRLAQLRLVEVEKAG